ncbi:BTAD domain-containing putative transcriptional regulator [Lentibacillus sediminis]|uniref:BTAD domain-containing putative transcriptional regulator n=1 Tax=Lentibacillus sediminis TaxID=1940529 RepID=UPI000C1B8C1F|nr:BTAD domain-containing putative transcriptional regulator [Lentibacillus sediminis]
MGTIPIIQSQFAPPPVKEWFVRRNQLNRKLSNIPAYRLTLLYAGAGYGKSTAMSLFIHDNATDACWYSLSQNDDDILPFLTKLIRSIKYRHPQFGTLIQKELEAIANYLSTEEVYALASTWINEVMELRSQVVLVLDDFHHVVHSKEIKQWLLFVLEHIPSNLHLVVSSRTKPDWEVVPKLKLKGELLEITQEDLSLSQEEMSFILEDMQHLKISDDEVSKIFQLTEGWTIAFNMLIQQLQAESISIEEIFQNRQKSLEDLFDYLASEVLSKQSLIIQQFLLQSSVMEVLSPDACDQILQLQGSKEILAGLVKQNAFIVEAKGEYYRYHALFKAFLENRLHLQYEAEYKELHKRAADYYESRQDIETALYHYQRIEAYPAIASLLNQHAPEMLRTGRLQILFELLISLPGVCKQKYPALYFYQGEIERYRSLYEQAEQNYETIINLVPEDEADYYYLAGLAYEGKARIYLDTIQPDKAERFVNQAIHMREKAKAPKEEMARLYMLMAENLLNAGQAVKAETWYDRATLLDLPVEESNLLARIYLRTGRLTKAKQLLIERKGAAVEQNTKHLPQSHRETDILLSIIEAYMGNALEGKKLGAAGIQLGLSIQSPFVEACGWMRMGHAVQLLDQYDMDLAVECYETALDIMEKINVSRGKAEPHMGLAILYGKKQDYERAIRHADKGLIETEKVNDRWLSAMIKLGRGLTEIYNGNYLKASCLIGKVRADMISCGDRYGVMVTDFWVAYIAMEKQDDPAFHEQMQRFLQEVRTGQYEFFLQKRTTFGPADMKNIAPMLLKAKELQIDPLYVSRLLYELGYGEDIKTHPGYTLAIHTLGGLNVWLGAKKLEPQDWQRGKAKELFALFITNRDHLLVKEEIFHHLWPEEAEQTANKKFKVTLNALLKALEPHRKAREDSFFITRSGSAYGLNMDAGYELDIHQFEERIMSGLEEKDPKSAKELLESGLQLYQGNYLAELRFASWSLAERERLQLLYLRGAEKLAQLAVRLLDFHLCIEWCEKILAVDNTWEEAYRLMMYSYYQNNNRPQAIRWYERCSRILNEELGVEPMEATQEMYELIIASGELYTHY